MHPCSLNAYPSSRPTCLSSILFPNKREAPLALGLGLGSSKRELFFLSRACSTKKTKFSCRTVKAKVQGLGGFAGRVDGRMDGWMGTRARGRDTQENVDAETVFAHLFCANGAKNDAEFIALGLRSNGRTVEVVLASGRRKLGSGSGGSRITHNLLYRGL